MKTIEVTDECYEVIMKDKTDKESLSEAIMSAYNFVYWETIGRSS